MKIKEFLDKETIQNLYKLSKTKQKKKVTKK